MTVDQKLSEDRRQPAALWRMCEDAARPLAGMAEDRDDTDLPIPPPPLTGWPRIYPGL